MHINEAFDTSEERRITRALAGGSVVPASAKPEMRELWTRWSALQEAWVEAELRVRALNAAQNRGDEIEATLVRQSELDDTAGEIERTVLGLRATGADEIAMLFDMALTRDVTMQKLAGDRLALDFLLAGLTMLAPSVTVGEIKRAARLGQITVEPAAATADENCASGAKISELWPRWSALNDEALPLALAGMTGRLLDRIDDAAGDLREKMLMLPVRDLDDVAALLDLFLELDAEPFEHPDDRQLLDHLVRELGRLTSVQIGALRRLEGKPALREMNRKGLDSAAFTMPGLRPNVDEIVDLVSDAGDDPCDLFAIARASLDAAEAVCRRMGPVRCNLQQDFVDALGTAFFAIARTMSIGRETAIGVLELVSMGEQEPTSTLAAE